MNPEKLIGIAAVAIAPVVIVTDCARKTKAAVENKIDEARVERYNRKHFDVQTGYIRRNKR